jgi:hypothetical protein
MFGFNGFVCVNFETYIWFGYVFTSFIVAWHYICNCVWLLVLHDLICYREVIFFLKIFRQNYFHFIIAYFFCRMLILLVVVSCRCLNSMLRMSMRWFKTIRLFTIMLHLFISFCFYIDFCLFCSVSICVWNAKWDVYTMLNFQRLLLLYNLLCRDIAYST